MIYRFISGLKLSAHANETLDERAFVKPTEFIPERWTTRKELTLDSSVFTPFGGGKCMLSSNYAW